MTRRLTPSTIILLSIAPLMWASNAVLGRMINDLVPPMTLNFFRWLLAFLVLLPMAHRVLHRDSLMWRHWRRFALLGLLSVGAYNSLQYLALHTSTAMNVTLVASSIPIWMLGLGWLLHGEKISRRQTWGAVLSIGGVLIVLSRGDTTVLMQMSLVPGDFYVLLATASWAGYSWMLARPTEPPAIRQDWAAFLLAQIFFGLLWSGLFVAGEWAWTPARIQWSWPVVAALVYITLGPALLSYRAWSAGIERAGPAVASFFSNLTPLFAALMSTIFLGEWPSLYHALAFGLIVGGIVVSSRRQSP
jgi:drug/metabolite transporter (DMT)-like permease